MAVRKKWLIATNGTKYASAAVRHAAELYKDLRHQPEVNILVVVTEGQTETEGKAIIELAKYMFEDIAGTEASLTTLVDFGDPGEVILEQQKKLKADHLFIGGADFKWDINSEDDGGISNFIIENISGRVTLIK